MPTRSFSLINFIYRFGYQGSEIDREVVVNSYHTFNRELNSNISRWWSIDPVFHPWESPYVSMGNNPIKFNDVFGDKIIYAKEKDIRRRQKAQIRARCKVDKEFRQDIRHFRYSRKDDLIIRDEQNSYKETTQNNEGDYETTEFKVNASSVFETEIREHRGRSYLDWNINLIKRPKSITFSCGNTHHSNNSEIEKLCLWLILNPNSKLTIKFEYGERNLLECDEGIPRWISRKTAIKQYNDINEYIKKTPYAKIYEIHNRIHFKLEFKKDLLEPKNQILNE